MTLVRTHQQIEWTKRSFEEARPRLVDDVGSLVPAGKSIPRDDEAAKGPLFAWQPFADVTNTPSRRKKVNFTVEDQVDDLLKGTTPPPETTPTGSRRPAPFALGGEWEPQEPPPPPPPEDDDIDDDEIDIPEPPPSPEPMEEEDDDEDERPLPTIFDDEPEIPVVVQQPPPKKKKIKPTRRIKPPPPPTRRYLVVNQPVSLLTARRTFRPAAPKATGPTVVRHFPKSPILHNQRYPHQKPSFQSEYDHSFNWPAPNLRLR